MKGSPFLAKILCVLGAAAAAAPGADARGTECVIDFLQQRTFARNLELDFTRRSGGLGNDGKVRIAPGTQRITPENISELFTHEYSSGKIGAKALGYIDSRGGSNFAFWRTGLGGKATNVHHRDVLANFVEGESNRIARLPADAVTNRALDDWLRFATLSDSLSTDRTHQAIPDDLLKRTQGFQLTATRRHDGVKVEYLDVDSSITATQFESGMRMSAKQMAYMIAGIYDRIDPRVRAIRAIRVSHLFEMRVDRHALITELRRRGVRAPVIERATTGSH